MTFQDRADTTTQAIAEVLDTAPSADQSKQIAVLVERAIIDSYQDAAERCAKVARDCCGADRDLARKVQDEIRRSNLTLIANLSSLR